MYRVFMDGQKVKTRKRDSSIHFLMDQKGTGGPSLIRSHSR